MALARIDSRYVCWLAWSDDNGFVKATAKRRLSMQARSAILKVFEGLGGGFVRGGYFEVAKQPRAQRGTIAEAGKRLLQEGIFRA